jgi:hypothetical protein
MDPETLKFAVQTRIVLNGQATTINATGTSKWIGAESRRSK